MKTVPHIVEDRHLKLFHPVGNSTGQRKVSKVQAQKKQETRIKKQKTQVPKKKKTIKGCVTKKSRQSVTRRQRSNIKDIFST